MGAMAAARVMIIAKILGLFALYAVWVMVALWISAQLFAGGNLDGNIPVLFLAGYIVLILAPLWVFSKWQDRTPGWVKQVQADGKQATAMIVKVGDTGITINNTRREILVQLRVEPPDGEPFEVIQQKDLFLFGGGGYSEGEHLQVKYDPNNRKHVVILDQSDAASSFGNASSSVSANSGYEERQFRREAKSPPADLARDLADLSKLHQSGELSDSEYEDAKRQILGK